MAGKSGEGSYDRLIASVYGAKNGTIIQNYKEYNVAIDFNKITLQLFMPFVHNGRYVNSIESIFNRTIQTNSWEKSLGYYGVINYLSDNDELVLQSHYYSSGYGFSLRCVAIVVFITCLC